MYRITYEHKDQSTENSLYIPADPNYCLITAVLNVEMGISGELKIEIPDINPARKQIECLTDEIIVYRDDTEIWRGRPITLQIDFNLTGKLTCEGILSYLNDTYYPPFEFEGSPLELLTMVINNHNSQVDERRQFQIGEITVEDNNDYINRSSIYYNKTITILQEKFIEDTLGGYFRARVENGVRYLDYLVAYNTESTQPVQYGYNLLDIAQNVSYSDVASVLLPLGAKLTDNEGMETDERLTVSSVNGGSIYIVDQQAVDTYGWIVTSETWDDVTIPENLLTKGQRYLEQLTAPISQFEIKAVDLSLADPELDPISLGDFVRIKVEPFDMDQYVELSKMQIDMLHVENSILTFGTDAATFTGSTTSSQRSIQESLGSLSMRVTSLTTNVLNAVYANIEHLITETITTEYIQAAVADLGYVTADWLEAYYIDAQTIYANFASIVQLEAVSGSITELDSDLANIKNVLAGNVGTGDLQTVILTAENAVIEEAVIVDALMNTVLASVLTAGIIYTDYIKIANNESQSLWIDGGTIQFTDENGTVREQLGVDASGVYNNYIWDENGVLIWNALGLTEEGLTGNGAIIKDAAVADDANISGYKLNIDEVTQILNANGDLVLNATQVTIDGETLDYHLTQITQSIDGISSEGITKIENYYCLGTEDAPYYPVGTSGFSSVLGSMILGQAQLGESGNGWTTEQPVTDIDEWVWFAQKATYIDGHEEWTEPVLLSDYYAHKHLGVLQTEFTVVQGQIEAKVWNDDIKTAVDEATGELTTVITEQYGDLTVTLDSISEVVGKLQTTVGEDYEELYSYISGITVDMNGIKEEVRETNQIVADNYSELSEKYAQIVIDTDSIRSEVGDVWTEITDNYMTTRETQALIEQITDENSATILQEVSYTYATKEEASEIDLLGCEKFANGYTEGWSSYDNSGLMYGSYNGGEYTYAVISQKEDGTDKRGGIQYLIEPLAAGTYTITFKVATTAGYDDVAQVSFGLNEKYWIMPSGNIKSNQWTTISGIVEIEDEVDSAYLVIRTTGSSDYYLYITDVQLIATGKQITRAIVSTNSTLKQYTDDKMAEALLQVSYTYTTQDEMIANTASIYQYVDDKVSSMTLSVENGELGSYAIINMNAGGTTSQIELDLQNVREHFAEEKSSITIAAGQIQFVSNTVVIDSTYFKVTAAGVITATSGEIGGWTIGTKSLYNGTSSMTSTTSGTYIGTDGIRQYKNGYYLTINSTTIENGNSNNTYVSLEQTHLKFYNTGTNLGYFGTATWSGTTQCGLTINTEHENNFIVFGHKTSSSATSYTADYLINYELSTSTLNGFYEKHIFFGLVGFESIVNHYSQIHMNRYAIYINDDCSFSSWNSGNDCGFSGGTVYTDSNIPLMIGNHKYDYMLGVYGDAYTTGDWYSGSDRSLKDNIKQLDINTNDSIIDAIEPVQYTYKDDTEKKIHFGVTYQNICEALEEAGLDPDSCAIVSKTTQKQAHPDDNDEPVTIESDENGEEIGAVAYMELIGPMITEIQKLRQRVAQLEQTIQ